MIPLLKVTGRHLTVSESTRKLNPELYEPQNGPAIAQESAQSVRNELGHGSTPEKLKSAPKRLRQSSKPVLNALETEFYNHLGHTAPGNAGPIRCQAKRYELARGMWYKPDFTCSNWPCEGEPSRETAWEVKGPHAFRGGFEALKMAARIWPEVRFILVWKEHGIWQTQRILS